MRPSGNSEVTSLSRGGRTLELTAKDLVGLDQRADFDVGDFRCAGHLQRGHDHLGDVFGLQQKLGPVFPAFGLIERLHSGRRRAPGIHAQHANAVGIDFLAQTIGEGL